jgi:hypothetical protein
MYAQRNAGIATQKLIDDAKAKPNTWDWAYQADPATGYTGTEITADDIWAQKPVGPNGDTQAQLDAAAGAKDVVNSINENYSGIGITSKIDPKTGKVITTQNGKVITNNAPGSPFATPTDTPDSQKKLVMLLVMLLLCLLIYLTLLLN